MKGALQQGDKINQVVSIVSAMFNCMERWNKRGLQADAMNEKEEVLV